MFLNPANKWFQYFVEAGVIALRRVPKDDLRHVSKATAATMVYSMFTFFY